MQPTKNRNPSSVLLRYKGHGILFDCGEGTQRQMKFASIPVTCITKILISHWHGDHVLGLLGIIQTLGASNYSSTLELYGPPGSKKYLKNMFDSISFDFRLNLNVVEVESGKFFENNEFAIECFPLKHNIPCIGFRFVEKDRRRIRVDVAKNIGLPTGPLLGKLQRGESVDFKGKKITPEQVTSIVKGKKISYLVDTGMVDTCYDLAEDVDVLICEASFARSLQAKAEDYLHLTGYDAGMIASKSNVKKLVLTHFSARYVNTDEIKNDAQEVFQNVVCAKDFMTLEI